MNKYNVRVKEALKNNVIECQIIEFSDITRTAQEAANAIGCQVEQIAKTLIFKTKLTNEPICIIASGKNRVDEKKVEKYISQEIEKSDAEFVLKNTGFVIGGVSPVGFLVEIQTLIDSDLMKLDFVWAAAGTPFSVFKISTGNLIKITKGKLVNVKK